MNLFDQIRYVNVNNLHVFHEVWKVFVRCLDELDRFYSHPAWICLMWIYVFRLPVHIKGLGLIRYRELAYLATSHTHNKHRGKSQVIFKNVNMFLEVCNFSNTDI